MSKCCCNKRILSSAIASGINDDCIDICVNPGCGDPKYLTVLTPVVYDELGINVCRSLPIPAGVTADFPTAVYAKAEVIDISYQLATTDAAGITITQIPQRGNCYEVTLSNLSVTFALKLYDCCNRLLTTLTLPGIIYLPPAITDAGYDEDTNPTSVSLELFAPYGVTYTDGNVETPSLNFIGFSTTNNQLVQGLNLMAIPKVLDFDMSGSTVTIGLTLIVKSVYFTQYQLPHMGKAIVSKGSLSSGEETVCMDFVNGSLLDRNIKPLETCNPCDKKTDCNPPDPTPCINEEPPSCPFTI